MGVQIEWKGEGAETLGSLRSSMWDHLTPSTILVEVDPRYFRPTEVKLSG